VVASGRIELNTPASARNTGTHRNLSARSTQTKTATAPTQRTSSSGISVPGIEGLNSYARSQATLVTSAARYEHSIEPLRFWKLVKIDQDVLAMLPHCDAHRMDGFARVRMLAFFYRLGGTDFGKANL
jgi:hypothetical protein